MLGVRDTRRVAWRREHAARHYLGYVTVTEDAVRLKGREQASGIDVALTIPRTAIRGIRVASNPAESVVGEPCVVLELGNDEPIYVRPVDSLPLALPAFARRLSSR
jgi:hypothetical protein